MSSVENLGKSIDADLYGYHRTGQLGVLQECNTPHVDDFCQAFLQSRIIDNYDTPVCSDVVENEKKQV